MPSIDPKFPGRVAPPLEPLAHSLDARPDEFEDLRLFVMSVVRHGGSLDKGYSRVTNDGRTVCASRNGKYFGQFTQLRRGKLLNGEPKYCYEGFGFLNLEDES